MKGWTREEQGIYQGANSCWTRRVGDRRLRIYPLLDGKCCAYSEPIVGKQVSLPLYNGDNLMPWDSPEDAAKALMERERLRAQQILADLEDPE